MDALAESANALPRQPGRRRRRDGLAALFLLGPSVALFTVFVWIPILGAFALSFFAWNLNGTPTWVGLANYRAMLHDPLVDKSVRNTLEFVAMGVVPTVFLGLGLAMLINLQFRGATIVRSHYPVPAAVSLAASTSFSMPRAGLFVEMVSIATLVFPMMPTSRLVDSWTRCTNESEYTHRWAT